MLSTLWNDEKLMSLIAGLFFVIALCLLGHATVQWLITRPVFALRQVVLLGDVGRINPVAFKTKVLPHIRGHFFSADLEKVRALVEVQPWVRSASVQRMWPNGLKIHLQAHTPLALWGENRLINTYGEVFSANIAELSEQTVGSQRDVKNDEQQWAVLHGPVGSELLVAKTYVQAVKQLQALGMLPVRLELSERYAWRMVTSTGLKIELGRDQDNLLVQQKLDRLVMVYPKIMGDVMSHIQSIDLRYPQAVAVKGDRTLVPHLAKMGHGI